MTDGKQERTNEEEETVSSSSLSDTSEVVLDEGESSPAVCMAAGALAAISCIALYDSVASQRWIAVVVHVVGVLSSILLWTARAKRPILQRPWLLPAAVLLQIVVHEASALLVGYLPKQSLEDSALIEASAAILPTLALLCATIIPSMSTWDRGITCSVGAVCHAMAVCFMLTKSRDAFAFDMVPTYLSGLLILIHSALCAFGVDSNMCTIAASAASLLGMLPVVGVSTYSAADVLPTIILAADTLIRAVSTNVPASEEDGKKNTVEKVVRVSDGKKGKEVAVAKVTKYKKGTTHVTTKNKTQ